MKVPRPRLRQVFEHTTTFRVQKPGAAKPITIAKSALSPNMVTKLRKFAKGGTVPAQGQADAAALAPAPAPAPAATYEDVVKAYEQEFNKDQPDENELQFLSETMQAMKPAAPAPAAAPVSAAPSPAAPAVEPVAAPAAPAVAPAVVAPPAPVAAPVAVVAPAVPPPAPPPAAPVAVAPVPAPAAPPKIEIEIPESVTDVSAESFKKALEANPTADQAEVATALVRKIRPDIPAPDFKALGERPPPTEGATALDRFDAAAAKKSEALTAEAKADFKTRQDLAAITQQAEARQLMAIKKNEDVAKNLASRREQLKDAYDKSEQETSRSFFSRLDTGQKIGSVIALAVGGFLSGSTGTPNYVYTAFNNAMDRDLENQKRRRDSILKQYERVLGDEEDAQKLARADLLNLTSLQIDAVKAHSNLRAVAPQLQKLQADLDMEAVKLREDVRKKMYDADKARIDADTEQRIRDAQAGRLERVPATAALGFARFDLARQRFKWAQENRDRSSVWSIPDPQDPTKDIAVKAVSPTAATSARKEVGQRVAALQRVEKLDNMLAKLESEGKSIDPNVVREIQTQLAEVVENYPSLSKGTTQMVTQAQAQLLKGALESTPIPYVRYTDFLGLTKTAIGKLREEGVNNLSLSVRSNAKPGDPGAAEFASKFGARGYRGKTGLARPGSAPQPAAGVAPTPTPQPSVVNMRAPDGKIYPINAEAKGKYLNPPYNYVEVQ